MSRSSSPFRFLSSSRRGQYSVWRGDEHLGYVTKVVHDFVIRGLSRTVFAWTPSTVQGRDLATVKTREAAARALWHSLTAGEST